jgi:hypothetical protein
MTEREWLALDGCSTRLEMYRVGTDLPPRFSRRHAHRVVAGCLPLIAHLFRDVRVRDAARYIERLADGTANWDERNYHHVTTHAAASNFADPTDARTPAERAATLAVRFGLQPTPDEILFALGQCVDALHSHTGKDYLSLSRPFVRILKDVAGNPFRRPWFDPGWRTSTAEALAEAIHAERAFDRMPILADALEEAGCDDPDILAHCREPDGVHVRGCWVVELVLGQT